MGDLPLSPNHYVVLHVHPAAPLDLVTAAYWRLAGQAQAARHDDAAAEVRLYQLTRSYQVLADSASRAEYDRSLGLPPQSLVPRLPRRRKPSLFGRIFGARFLRRRGGPPVDYYEVLRVHPTADTPLLTEAYTIMRNYYVRLVRVGNESPDWLDWLEEAYAVTSDPIRRAQYDGPRETHAPSPVGAASSAPVDAALASLPPPTPVPAAAGPELHTAEKASTPVVEKPQAAVAPDARKPAVSRADVLKPAIAPLRRLAAAAARRVRESTAGLYAALSRTVRWLAAGVRRTVAVRRRRLDSRTAVGEEEAFLRRLAMAPKQTASLEAGAAAVAELTLIDGPGSGASFEVKHLPLTLGGSEQCEINLPGLAPQQARLIYREGRFVVFNLSDNPAMEINGDAVAWSVVEDGDSLGLGPYRLRLNLSQE